MNRYARIAFLAVSIGGLGQAHAGIPMDSFNSANAALIPSMAVDPQSAAAQSSRGPAAALAKMALGDRKLGEVEAVKPLPALQPTADEPDAP